MRALKTEDLQILLSQGLWGNAVSDLNLLDPPVAGDIFLSLSIRGAARNPIERLNVLDELRRIPGGGGQGR